METSLNSKQIQILSQKVVSWLKLKDDLSFEMHQDQILFKNKTGIVAYFHFDNLFFSDESVLIVPQHHPHSFYQSVWYKLLKSLVKQYRKTNNYRVYLEYLKQIKNLVHFIKQMPESFLTDQFQQWKTILTKTGSPCVFCQENSCTIHHQKMATCLFCRKTYSHLNFHAPVKFNKTFMDLFLKWDKLMRDVLSNDLTLNLYAHAMIMAENLDLNLSLKDYTNTMKKYRNQGFEATDDQGQVYTFFWFLYDIDYSPVFDQKYFITFYDRFVAKAQAAVEYYSQLYPDLKFNLIGINRTRNLQELQLSLHGKDNHDPQNLAILNQQMYETFKQPEIFSQFSQLQNFYFFNNFYNNHEVVGFPEMNNEVLKYLFGVCDDNAFRYDNQTKSFEFWGPEFGLMQLVLAELNLLTNIKLLETFVYSWEIQLTKATYFKPSFILRWQLETIFEFLPIFLKKLLELKYQLQANLVKKPS